MADNIFNQNEDIYDDLDGTIEPQDPRMKSHRKSNTVILEDDKNSESLSLLSNAVRNATQRQNDIEKVFNVVSNRAMLETEMWKSEMTLYDDLVTAEVKEREEKLKRAIKYEELCREVNRLKNLIIEKDTKISDLMQQNSNLKKNICSLYKTAKSEIERKDNLLLEANKKLDMFKFSKNIPFKFSNDKQDKNPTETFGEAVKNTSNYLEKQIPKTICAKSLDNQNKNLTEATKTALHYSNRDYKSRDWRCSGKKERQRESYYNRSSASNRNSPFKRRRDYYHRRESSYRLRSKDIKRKIQDNLKIDENRERKFNKTKSSISTSKIKDSKNKTINSNFKEKTSDQNKLFSDEKQFNSKDESHNTNKSNSGKLLKLNQQETSSKLDSYSDICTSEQQDVNNSEQGAMICNKKEHTTSQVNLQNASLNVHEHALMVVDRTEKDNRSFMEVDNVHGAICSSNQNNNIENFSDSQNQNVLNSDKNKITQHNNNDGIRSKDLVNCEESIINQSNSQTAIEPKSHQVVPDSIFTKKQSFNDDQASIIVNRITEADRNEMEEDNLHSPLSSVNENKDAKTSMNSEQKHFDIFPDMTTTNALFFGLLPIDIRQSFMQYEQNQITSMNRLKQSFLNYFFKHSEAMSSYVCNSPSEQQSTPENFLAKIQNSSANKDPDSLLFFFENNCYKKKFFDNSSTSHVEKHQGIDENDKNVSTSEGLITTENVPQYDNTIPVPILTNKSICSQEDECNTDSTKEIPAVYREMFNKPQPPIPEISLSNSNTGNLSSTKIGDPESINPIISQSTAYNNPSLINDNEKNNSSHNDYAQKSLNAEKNVPDIENKSSGSNCDHQNVNIISSQNVDYNDLMLSVHNKNADSSQGIPISNVIESTSNVENKTISNSDPERINVTESQNSINNSSLNNDKNINSSNDFYVQRDNKYVNAESHHPSFSSVYYRRQLLKFAVEEKKTKGLTKAIKEDIAKLYKYRNSKRSIIVKKKIS